VCYFEDIDTVFVLTVALKDRCKMFCRVAGSSAYYMLSDRVVDGTKCGPYTSDICVQSKCQVQHLSSSHNLWLPMLLFSPFIQWGPLVKVSEC